MAFLEGSRLFWLRVPIFSADGAIFSAAGFCPSKKAAIPGCPVGAWETKKTKKTKTGEIPNKERRSEPSRRQGLPAGLFLLFFCCCNRIHLV